MKPPGEKAIPDKSQVQPKSPRPAEVWQILEDYANDLREVIKKLRGRLG